MLISIFFPIRCLYPYNKSWSDYIERNFDNISEVGQFACKINDKTIWIGNWSYCYGTPYNSNEVVPFRPSRKVIFLLNRRIKEIQRQQLEESLKS